MVFCNYQGYQIHYNYSFIFLSILCLQNSLNTSFEQGKYILKSQLSISEIKCIKLVRKKGRFRKVLIQSRQVKVG